MLSKLSLYARAAFAQRSINLRGLPFIPKTLGSRTAFHREGFNQFVLWIAQLRLPRVDWVVDVGANHGDFSLAAATLYPKCNVLLVEPLPVLHGELQKLCARFGGRWSLAPFALGDKPGTATLYTDPNFDAIGSLVGFSDNYIHTSPQVQGNEKLTCTVRTLDDLCAEHRIASIDVLKIDVEGFEFETLHGAEKTLCKTSALIVELSLVRRGEDRNALARMLDLVSNAGFHVVNIHPSLYPRDTPWRPVEFNILARRL